MAEIDRNFICAVMKKDSTAEVSQRRETSGQKKRQYVLSF